MDKLSTEQILVFAVVFFAIVQCYNTVMTALEHYRKDKQQSPTANLEVKVSEHARMLASDKMRIERLEADSSLYNKEMKLLLKSQMALLRHGIDGNNIDGLKENQQEINEFLLDLK